MKKLRNYIEGMENLEERIFAFILVVGTVVVIASAFVTMAEKLSIFATLCSFIIAILFIFTIYLNFKLKKKNLSRLLIAYSLNCIFMPVTFYSCGGIDSGMPLYILAGLFMIVITLEGKQRIACFIISLLTNMCAIGISYNSMEGTKAKTLINNKLLPRLTLEDRIIDMECSIALVSLFLGLTTFLVLNAYQKERTKKEELLQKVNEISKRDALTGAYNRRELYNYFDKINNGEFGTDFKNSFYIAMMDIDYFKKINDTYGHIFGDKALIKISGLLKDECKENEIVVRYGGEEFVLLFLAADNKEAFNRIDNIRQKVMDCKWKKYPDLSITISGGISKNSDFDNFENALNSADEQLYKAKNNGRNMVLGL